MKLLQFDEFYVQFSCENFIDVKFSALLLTAEKKIPDSNYFVNENSTCRYFCDGTIMRRGLGNIFEQCDPEFSVMRIKDNINCFKVNLLNVSEKIQEVIFVAYINGLSKNSFYGQKIQLQLRAGENLLYEEEFPIDTLDCNIVEILKLVRDLQGWFVESVKVGSNEGLGWIKAKYF